MKMYIFLLGLLAFTVAEAQIKQKFTIKGDVSSVNEKLEKVYFRYRLEGKNVDDSVRVKNNQYVLTGIIDEPVMLAMSAGYVNPLVEHDYRRDYETIHITPGTIATVKHHETFASADVKGSAAQDEYMKLHSRLVNGETDFVPDYIRQHPNSPLALFLLNYFVIGPSLNPDTAEPFYNLLSEQNKNTPTGRKLRENIDATRRTAIGKMAPEIQQKNEAGQAVSLSGFKGKYVLVEFWASWCGPCRKENPALLATYQKYHSKGFDIFGISVDTDKNSWLNAVKKDGLEWVNTADLQDSDHNPAAKMYAVSGIPTSWLVDPNGKIVAKNLRGQALENKLAEIFK
ncbi:MAG: AhpC/TSA family protein [Chitinophagaceae bacterium]|nr:AhpC/TSA family protein [Chitinophagaceae bacterium]